MEGSPRGYGPERSEPPRTTDGQRSPGVAPGLTPGQLSVARSGRLPAAGGLEQPLSTARTVQAAVPSEEQPATAATAATGDRGEDGSASEQPAAPATAEEPAEPVPSGGGGRDGGSPRPPGAAESPEPAEGDDQKREQSVGRKVLGLIGRSPEGTATDSSSSGAETPSRTERFRAGAVRSLYYTLGIGGGRAHEQMLRDTIRKETAAEAQDGAEATGSATEQPPAAPSDPELPEHLLRDSAPQPAEPVFSAPGAVETEDAGNEAHWPGLSTGGHLPDDADTPWPGLPQETEVTDAHRYPGEGLPPDDGAETHDTHALAPLTRVGTEYTLSSAVTSADPADRAVVVRGNIDALPDGTRHATVDGIQVSDAARRAFRSAAQPWPEGRQDAGDALADFARKAVVDHGASKIQKVLSFRDELRAWTELFGDKNTELLDENNRRLISVETAPKYLAGGGSGMKPIRRIVATSDLQTPEVRGKLGLPPLETAVEPVPNQGVGSKALSFLTRPVRSPAIGQESGGFNYSTESLREELKFGITPLEGPSRTISGAIEQLYGDRRHAVVEEFELTPAPPAVGAAGDERLASEATLLEGGDLLRKFGTEAADRRAEVMGMTLTDPQQLTIWRRTFGDANSFLSDADTNEPVPADEATAKLVHNVGRPQPVHRIAVQSRLDDPDMRRHWRLTGR